MGRRGEKGGGSIQVFRLRGGAGQVSGAGAHALKDVGDLNGMY